MIHTAVATMANRVLYGGLAERLNALVLKTSEG